MEYVDISDIEQLIMAKVTIENKLKEANEDYENLKLEEFVVKYAALSNVIVDNGEILPFSIVDVEGEKYLMYSSETDKSLDKIKSHLKNIDYDLSKLKELSYREMVMKLDDLNSYYMIGSKFYVE